MNGKGSTPRPLSVPRVEYDDAWERTFGRKDASPWPTRTVSVEELREMYPDHLVEADGIQIGEWQVDG